MLRDGSSVVEGSAVTGSKSILTIALDSETFDRIAPILRRSSLSVEVTRQAAEAADLAMREQYHLIVCRYPLPDMKLREFVALIRGPDSASKEASLLVLTIPEMRTEARSGVRGGPFLVFSQQEQLGALDEGTAHLLEVAPRYAPRITTRLRVNVGSDSESYDAWIVNLSISGMLVTDAPMLAVGSECSFEFNLPRGIGMARGSAEVVRHTTPRRERVAGFAVRFVAFEPGCAEMLEEWCATAVATSPQNR
jgi:CheY-like chemotaxis protein